ncbi:MULTISPECIES: hypothetical protein [Streptomycetaceae]|uniref:DUF916 domain-containing protein n=1 Tax=Streptantibioticus cattleyicolor (strain ATCC 35852 / DSM 46488 / JCM 4925 / NBRC 14057 / NRRL 8057) TaxID=1003195 RepID=F8JVE7_STREN|nr:MULTISPECIES: hypothetical protein [Streptomycetaceae]AEW94430.1 hypothetical protein SCATT_20590 [Streptantibioticus cattleyicolor NRRL 8057 = DSM 46488]MYS59078.1 hypothetical protein [Streptomyces sp. SID5468]CCB74788.1 conserved exported protein of unknown function [Streptantibioticus cattleyicolor NRRL 8057 = DSM 46488]
MASPTSPRPARPARRWRAAGLLVLACAATGGWTARPAGDRPYVYLEGPPGAVLHDAVSVTETGRTAERFTVRGADAVAGPGGGVTAGDPATAADAGGWLRFADAAPRIPARTRADVPFTVTVPADARPGGHPAAVVVTSESGRRAVVPVHLRVTGRELTALSVTGVGVGPAPGGGARIHGTLVNRGNTEVSAPSLDVRADGLLGTSWRPAAYRPAVTVAPGRSAAFSLVWPHPPAADRVRIRVTATVPGAPPATATAGWTAVSTGALAVALPVAGAGLGAAGLWSRRRRGGRPPRRETGARP